MQPFLAFVIAANAFHGKFRHPCRLSIVDKEREIDSGFAAAESEEARSRKCRYVGKSPFATLEY